MGSLQATAVSYFALNIFSTGRSSFPFWCAKSSPQAATVRRFRAQNLLHSDVFIPSCFPLAFYAFLILPRFLNQRRLSKWYFISRINFLFFLLLEVNCRDYRAWYGLGQTYEILKMPFYCLYYYRQAHKFRYALLSWHARKFAPYKIFVSEFLHSLIVTLLRCFSTFDMNKLGKIRQHH